MLVEEVTFIRVYRKVGKKIKIGSRVESHLPKGPKILIVNFVVLSSITLLHGLSLLYSVVFSHMLR